MNQKVIMKKVQMRNLVRMVVILCVAASFMACGNKGPKPVPGNVIDKELPTFTVTGKGALPEQRENPQRVVVNGKGDVILTINGMLSGKGTLSVSKQKQGEKYYTLTDNTTGKEGDIVSLPATLKIKANNETGAKLRSFSLKIYVTEAPERSRTVTFIQGPQAPAQ